MIRHRGFVLGSDPSPQGGRIWKVRVKDDKSSYNGQKLIVASVHDNFGLAQGLNINFAIGSIDGPSGSKILRAVDVRLD